VAAKIGWKGHIAVPGVLEGLPHIPLRCRPVRQPNRARADLIAAEQTRQLPRRERRSMRVGVPRRLVVLAEGLEELGGREPIDVETLEDGARVGEQAEAER